MPRAVADPSLSRKERWLVATGAWLLWGLGLLMSRTWRFAAVAGEEHLEQLLQSGQPAILAVWHNRLAICGHWVARRLLRRGCPVVVLSSLSRDGELLARVLRLSGFGVVRGSPTRGGLAGLRNLYRAISRSDSWVALAPDGSQGPVYECKPGVLLLAQVARAPILPLGGAAVRPWRLRSWDRLIVPRPFSRIAVAIGEPIRVSQDLGMSELEDESRRLGERLTDLVAQARLACETPDAI